MSILLPSGKERCAGKFFQLICWQARFALPPPSVSRASAGLFTLHSSAARSYVRNGHQSLATSYADATINLQIQKCSSTFCYSRICNFMGFSQPILDLSQCLRPSTTISVSTAPSHLFRHTNRILSLSPAPSCSHQRNPRQAHRHEQLVAHRRRSPTSLLGMNPLDPHSLCPVTARDATPS